MLQQDRSLAHAGSPVRQGGDRRLPVRATIGSMLATLIAFGTTAHAAGGYEWPVWGGSISGKSSAQTETTISPATVSALKPKWVFASHGDITSTPTVDGDYLYVNDWAGYIYKIRRADGSAVWERKLSDLTGNLFSLSRNSPAITSTSLIFGDRASAQVLSLDKVTGQLQWKVNIDTDGKGLITSSPMVYNGVAYVGVASLGEATIVFDGVRNTVFRGSVWALDLNNNGAELWHHNTAPPGYTGAGVWSSPIVVDPARQSIYVTTGDNITVPAPVAACLNAIPGNQNWSDPAILARQLTCLDPEDYVDAIVAFDMKTGKTRWSQRMMGADSWNAFCVANVKAGCPFKGVDWDFGSGPNLIDTVIRGQHRQLLGAGQKNGYYWALDPDNGAIIWSNAAGPPTLFGGIHWGTATDDKRVYVPESNASSQAVTLTDGSRGSGAYWAALDAATGKTLWQNKAIQPGWFGPQAASIDGALTVANGVLFGGMNNGDFIAMDAGTGKELWRFASGGSVLGAPSVVDGEVYWGTGYYLGKSSHQLYAFQLKAAP